MLARAPESACSSSATPKLALLHCTASKTSPTLAHGRSSGAALPAGHVATKRSTVAEWHAEPAPPW